jgi:hypothetical protein
MKHAVLMRSGCVIYITKFHEDRFRKSEVNEGGSQTAYWLAPRCVQLRTVTEVDLAGGGGLCTACAQMDSSCSKGMPIRPNDTNMATGEGRGIGFESTGSEFHCTSRDCSLGVKRPGLEANHH